MGFDVHALNFLLYCSRKQPLGRMVTIGRQSIAVKDWRHVHAAAELGRPAYATFSEDFVREYLAAETVESYDYSDYQGATHVADFNRPLPSHATFDTVVDCGTIEHVYNAPQALQNMADLCEIGGQLIHVTPANNFCGHGFWQFSPELFFARYTEANGFAEAEVFVADLAEERDWFEVSRPVRQERAEIVSSTPLYVMCRTTLRARREIAVLETDYAYLWSVHGGTAPNEPGLVPSVKSAIKRSPFAGMAKATLGFVRDHKPKSLSFVNPHLKRRSVEGLLRG